MTSLILVRIYNQSSSHKQLIMTSLTLVRIYNQSSEGPRDGGYKKWKERFSKNIYVCIIGYFKSLVEKILLL